MFLCPGPRVPGVLTPRPSRVGHSVNLVVSTTPYILSLVSSLLPRVDKGFRVTSSPPTSNREIEGEHSKDPFVWYLKIPSVRSPHLNDLSLSLTVVVLVTHPTPTVGDRSRREGEVLDPWRWGRRPSRPTTGLRWEPVHSTQWV